MSDYRYQQKRIIHDDGTWSDVSIVEFPADKLKFQNIVLRDYETRLRDIAHLRSIKARQYGQINPIIVVWACLEDYKSAQEIFLDINAITDEGEHLLSANSLMNYTLRTLLARNWLFYENNAWQLDVPSHETLWQKRASTILEWLIDNKRLWIEIPQNYHISRQDFVEFKVFTNAIPVGNLNFLRREVQEKRYRVAFNAAYFLLEHDDFDNFHSALGDAHSLFVLDGQVIRPPLYRRSAFWCDEQWQINQIGMHDINLHIGQDMVISANENTASPTLACDVNPETASRIAMYTRYYGVESHGRALAYTPTTTDRLEFTIIDNHIVGWKTGGNLHIPQNGFVLSFAPDSLSTEQIDDILETQHIRYTMLGKFKGMRQAIQSGPALIRDGQILNDNAIFEREEFWVSQMIDEEFILGVAPTDYPDNVDETRAGRLAIGIKADGDLVVVAVAGVNFGYNLDNTDSNGATLVEVANYLLSAGAIDAVNLDGGGSAQLFYDYGAMVLFGDRRSSPGIIYERMIPSAGVVT